MNHIVSIRFDIEKKASSGIVFTYAGTAGVTSESAGADGEAGAGAGSA